MKQTQISAIILAKNEQDMIANCIHTLRWCDEILVLDDGSTDNTVGIAENLGAKVISFKHSSFARKREEAAKHAVGPWIFYIDADERVLPSLANEIIAHCSSKDPVAGRCLRENYFYGQKVLYGGWGNDYVTRLFPKNNLTGWEGDIHESPKFSLEITTFKTPLIHLSHRTIRDGLRKSADWTAKEAALLAKSSRQPVSLLTVLRKGTGELWRRLLLWKGYKDGAVGFVESTIQALNRILVYLQVWELQQHPPIEERYRIKEREIELQWEHSNKESL